jgi:hypothetical protein
MRKTMTPGNRGNQTGRRGRGYRSRLTAAEQEALDALARTHGYESVLDDGVALRPGVVFALAIIAGEVATVLLGDEERARAISLLEASGDEVLSSIARQLRAAAEREQSHDNEELADYRAE